MSESIERMRKLVDDNLVMGLRFQMNRELNELESEIEQELNAIALEEIVRCRDCVFFAADVETVDERGEQIATGNLCEWTGLWVEPNGFCSWAERRDA